MLSPVEFERQRKLKESAQYMTSHKPDIIALGEALIEFVALPNEPGEAPMYRQGFGGDTSNAMIAAARQGASTGYLSAVGQDPFGEQLIELWKREGVDSSKVRQVESGYTGIYFVQPDPSGRKFSYARKGSAASQFTPEELPKKYIAEAKILHISALSQAVSCDMRASVRRAADIAAANGTAISYDTNLRLNLWTLEEAKQEILGFLPKANYVFPSVDEAELLTGLDSIDEILDFFLGFDPAIVLLKCGEAGAVLATKGRRTTIKPYLTKPVDSTGAGDSFAGAFLAYFLETGDAERAANLATIVASGTVSGMGAVAPIPLRKAVLDREKNTK